MKGIIGYGEERMKKMGKIYTSHFGNLSKLEKKGIKPISIALFPPKWYDGDALLDLTPDLTIFTGYKENIITEERFKKFYKYKIKQLGKERILKMIEDIADGQDVALICFEAPGGFCHRHILADYLDIEEYK